MNEELQDYDLKSDGSGPSPDEAQDGTSRRRLALAAVVLVLILAGVFWLLRDQEEEIPAPEIAPTPVVAEPDEAAAPGRLDLGEIPPLVDSDEWLRDVVSQVSSHPQLAEWLITPDLIRGFVVVVDNVAEGSSPAKHLRVAAPESDFGVRESGESIYIDSASYDRFDLLIDVIESLDTEGTAELYESIRPWCQQSYQDLGYPGDDFDSRLYRAIQRILATPVVEGPIELEPKVTAYQFADPALEELSPAAKQFLRLGPDNLERLQAKLRELAMAIGLEN